MKVGRIQTLVVSRISDYGLYLKDDEESEVLLPNRFVSLDMKVGDSIEVFVYHDSEDRLVASTERPKITEGCVAWLEVVDKSFHGAFLDWGLSSKHSCTCMSTSAAAAAWLPTSSRLSSITIRRLR